MVILYTISRDGIRDREENTMAKYCTQCGRKLEDGEVCTCTSQNNNAAGASRTSPGGQQQYQQTQQQGQTGGYTKEAEWINKQKDAFVSGTKSMFSEILPILKSPVSRVRKISSSGNAATGIQLIIAKAVIFLVVIIIALFVTAHRINEASYGFIEADIPYFQVIILTDRKSVV